MDAPERDPRPDLSAPEEAPGVPEARAEASEDPAPPDDGRAARVDRARAAGFDVLLFLLDRLLPGAAEVGGDAAPGVEAIRFRHDPSLAFSPGEVVRVEEQALPPDPTDFTDRTRLRWEVTTAFLGLTGATSPLPHYLTEEVVQHDPEDRRSRDFLDLFHHRMLSFLARGFLKYDAAAAHLSDCSDPWSRRLLAWIGEDLEGAPGLLPLAERACLLRGAPLLAERALTADGLEALLADALAGTLEGDARIAVEQFVGSWGPIPPGDRTRLGVNASTLGQSVVLGRQVFDPVAGVAAVVGPLDAAGYQRFAVERESTDRLREVMRILTRGAVHCEVVLLLAPEAAPPARVGAAGARLGVDAWLGKQGRAARMRVGAAAS